uniref:Elongation factor Ts, mitochondrial n=1 Tax=Centroceras clavulatum TaxID=159503 RepID=A0A4D6WRP5_9FLOR|nr:Translation elongation factor Ts [Centroceras clavulatum]
MIEETSLEKIKELRAKTGAGITDCKKALDASNGQINIAIDNLRKKGLASADKKSNRVATEGLIESYIHAGSRIGVLVELNCETDFVAKQDIFKKLTKNIAMQIAASQNVHYISSTNIPQSVIDHEMSIENDKDDLTNKPQEIKNKILAGRVNKRLKELSLMDQPFIKDITISIEELIKQHIALLGENIKIRRFERFILGEGLEKKNEDFANEIAKMIQNK